MTLTVAPLSGSGAPGWRPAAFERMRKAVETHRFVYEGTHIPITISLGVAGLPNPAVKDASDLVNLADKALYQSKHGGRNRVTVHKIA